MQCTVHERRRTADACPTASAKDRRADEAGIWRDHVLRSKLLQIVPFRAATNRARSRSPPDQQASLRAGRFHPKTDRMSRLLQEVFLGAIVATPPTTELSTPEPSMCHVWTQVPHQGRSVLSRAKPLRKEAVPVRNLPEALL